jgi:2-methylisocitrate lyase-like PEP mutase family enzyme
MKMRDKAINFRQMHHNEELLILPNAWDAASAVALSASGACAVATSSAGLAWPARAVL